MADKVGVWGGSKNGASGRQITKTVQVVQPPPSEDCAGPPACSDSSGTEKSVTIVGVSLYIRRFLVKTTCIPLGTNFFRFSYCSASL